LSDSRNPSAVAQRGRGALRSGVVALLAFPLQVAPGFRATAVDTKHSGAQCPNSAGRDPRTYRTYGVDHPIERPVLYPSFADRRGEYFHHATDILCPRGTPVVSTTDGRVLVETRYRGSTRPGAGHSERGGWYVYVRDHDGNTHYYAHMKDLRVRPGDAVRAGQKLGTCWDSGNAQGGCPHVHYQVRDAAGRAVDPFPLLRPIYEAGGWQGRPVGNGGDVLSIALPVVGTVVVVAAAGFAFWAWRRSR